MPAARLLPLPLLPLLPLLACVPQVSATIDSPQPAPAVHPPEAETVAAASSAEFDLELALDSYERLLIGLDILLDAGPPPEVELPDTYLDDQGVRPLYGYAQHVVGSSLYGLAARVFETEVYLSGPHGEQPVLHADSFGHYNPLFVTRVELAAAALAADRARVERTRGAFERTLKRQAQTYLLVHEAVHADPVWFEGFRAAYEAKLASSSYFGYWEQLNPMSTAFGRAGYSWYETDTAAYFWLRREIDGSAEAWRAALTQLLAAYGAVPGGGPPGYPI